MALQASYKRFLAAPNSSALAANASLHYITTTTSFAGATEIIKHLGSVRNQLKKNKEDVLFAIAGQNAVAVETETTLEFTAGGGPYLPGLDDNFVADRIVYLVITHIVTFDGEGKITQIRQSWDQGSLLKQLDVIGKSGRNWPIRDSKDQIGLIARCIKSNGVPAEPTPQELVNRSRGNSNNILRDPHASLSLFASRDEVESSQPTVISPYAGTRPHQRSFTDIMSDEPEDDEPTSPSRGRQREQSPSKAIAPKIGSGKNFQPSRLFNTDEVTAPTPDSPEQSPNRLIRPNPKKYQHFDFADGTEPQDAPKAGLDFAQKPKTKHDNSWTFDDFVTPQKPTAQRTMHKARDVRHWGNDGDIIEETPEVKGHQVKARINAESHFDLVDDGPEKTPRIVGRPRGSAHNTGLGLYENNLYNEDGSKPTPGGPPLGNITNQASRHKDFQPHFNMTDESPKVEEAAARVGDDRKKVVRHMESNWSSYDQSPDSRKENSNPNPKKLIEERGIATAGDGMGGKKGSGREWGIGDEDDEGHGVPNVPGKQQKGTFAKPSNFWDY
ncbi:hypothetical protein B0H63DRAFT_37167 [Podospora didyma]|uniref:NTF2-like protein n=1 Tax=Podospora didyma TaxID=330526 RepID=A0AAE0P6A5_9PEZI|nr:hypothetical protein B0H63DRAFT_37167 [Podospora didyma]